MFELREIAQFNRCDQPGGLPGSAAMPPRAGVLAGGPIELDRHRGFCLRFELASSHAAPALWREWAAIRCDGHRRAFYHLTESGAAILADSQSDAREKLAETERPPFKPAATSRYWDMFITALEARNTFVDEECRRELGLLPLPVRCRRFAN